MVVGFLGLHRDPGHEGEGLTEIGELEASLQALAIGVVAPAGELLQRRLAGGLVEPCHSSLPPVLVLAYVARGMGHGQTLAPDAAEIERLADAAIARLPEMFRRHLTHVVLRVEEFADEEVLKALGIEDPFDLSGLYSGRSIDKQSSLDSGDLPPMIHLYRRPLLDEWVETGVGLEDLITHVIVHEVGHHFGFSDADMHWIEEQAG